MSTPTHPAPVIVLFRNDLRTGDNGALAKAAESGNTVVPIFILDEESDGQRLAGAAARWWLHHSLAALQGKLKQLGATLIVRRGRTDRIVADAIDRTAARAVFWNRRYDPAGVAIDKALKSSLREKGIVAESFDGALLHEPSRLTTQAGGFFKVYGSFWKALCASPEPRDPFDPPKSLNGWEGGLDSGSLDALKLLPKNPDWSVGLARHWTQGEDGAHRRFEEFVALRLDGYSDGRDRPGEDGTSRLSPHLAHGEITPFQIFAALRRKGAQKVPADTEKFRKEVGWREFSYHLLFHNPELHRTNFQPGFEGFEWRQDAKGLHAWQRGLTGFPIVDAGMRELWQTGWMHNRVRMIAASFLIKDLLVDWREGEKWFWDTLVDADPANNAASWQWVAGSGADAAPYFRIFNPSLQGEKFDPQGTYVRRYVPELAKLPDRYIHRPWEAPASILKESGVEPGKTYPPPIVDHGEARQRALVAYRATRQ